MDEQTFRRELASAPRLMTRHDPRFAPFDRTAFLSEHGLTDEEGEALDQIVRDAGGGVRLIPAPARRALPARRRTPDPATIAWDVPLEWLRGAGSVGSAS